MTSAIKARVKKFFAAVALMSVELLILWTLFFSCIIIFVVIAYRIFGLNRDDFDTRAFNFLAAYVSDTNTSIVEFITFLGNHNFLIPANLVLVAYFLFIKKHRWYSIKIPVVAIGGVTMMALLKLLFNRPRPLIPLLEPAKGLSFPSGHAMMSVSFYGLLIYLVYENVRNLYLRWALIGLLILLILAIGITRIYLRVHYASDVIAGFAIGVIWIFLSLFIIRRMERYSQREIDPELKKEELA
jgi:undecaprenyl-diphosphatase